MTLGQWRAAQSPPATLTAVANALDVSHSLVLEWERGSRRPGIELALKIEAHTGGAVPIETWGYTRALVDLMRAAVSRRDEQSVDTDTTDLAATGS